MRRRGPFDSLTKLLGTALTALLIQLPLAAAADNGPLPFPPLGPEVTPEVAREPPAPSGGCGFSDETACHADANCYWQEIYGIVPGGPAAAFCRPRKHAARPPRN